MKNFLSSLRGEKENDATVLQYKKQFFIFALSSNQDYLSIHAIKVLIMRKNIIIKEGKSICYFKKLK